MNACRVLLGNTTHIANPLVPESPTRMILYLVGPTSPVVLLRATGVECCGGQNISDPRYLAVMCGQMMNEAERALEVLEQNSRFVRVSVSFIPSRVHPNTKVVRMRGCARRGWYAFVLGGEAARRDLSHKQSATTVSSTSVRTTPTITTKKTSIKDEDINNRTNTSYHYPLTTES